MEPAVILGLVDDGILDAREVLAEVLDKLSSLDILEMVEKHNWPTANHYYDDDEYCGIEGIDF